MKHYYAELKAIRQAAHWIKLRIGKLQGEIERQKRWEKASGRPWR